MAAYGWPLEYILDLTVPQIRLLLKWKDKRERGQMLWQAQIAATAMFALAPEQGADYLDKIRELLDEGGAESENGGWDVPASIPRLEDLAGGMRTPKGISLPIRIAKSAPPEGTD